MDLNDYQRLAGRTECDNESSRRRMAGAATLTVEAFVVGSDSERLLPIRLNHGATGIVKEGGEILSLLERWLYYGKPLDRDAVRAELGDVLWYLALSCSALGLSMSDVAESNIRKLRVRYPDRYSNGAAENRDIEAERMASCDEPDEM